MDHHALHPPPPSAGSVTPADSRSAGFVLAIVAWLFSAGVYIAVKWAADDMPPWAMTFWRVSVAGIVLVPLVARQLREIVAAWRAHPVGVVFVGTMGLCLSQGFMFTALTYTNAINAGIIFAASPLLIAILAVPVLGESLRVVQVLAAIVALLGTVVVACRGDPEVLATLDLNQGDVWALGSAVCFACYTVLLRRLKLALSGLPLLVLMLASASLVSAPLYLWELAREGASAISHRGFVAVAYAAIPGGALMYYLYNRSVVALGASTAGVAFYLQTVYIIILADALLGERLAPYHFAGIALIVAGVVAFTWAKAKRKEPAGASQT
ncbi:MAG: DMT family transporter [Alphaproteobacteria bacterium]